MSNQYPRAHQSAARRAQLERLKEQRRAMRQSKTRLPRAAIDEDAPAFAITYRELIAELQRIAMAGVMPSAARFDFAKPATWPTLEECCAHFGLSWDALAHEAGLRLKLVTVDMER